jgi:hypothetical protein
VSRSEVKQVFRAMNQKPAGGCDGITYATIIHLNSTNPDIIPHIATALLRFGYHYHKWKHAICVIIPKQGKSVYKQKNPTVQYLSYRASVGSLKKSQQLEYRMLERFVAQSLDFSLVIRIATQKVMYYFKL